ncbi:MAG: hypothetical protein M1834_001576 [Cirrosporium novae-zelandiae]|nr:MAG: hypothetical protein M1834_004093 [Cirrosporium novae-zelandiae]KAI9735561.1 MAG: hypothetical protein M1834_001576 [Cirrosporium novae-zelandiae]
MPDAIISDEEDLVNSYRPWYNNFTKKAILVNKDPTTPSPVHLFLSPPISAPLLFPNTASDARDHLANERTFLSYLRLSIYLAIVSSAILLSFHLQHKATPLEKRYALPLGIIFWVLALACLINGVANYVKTVGKYGRRKGKVQSGWKTQTVFTIVATAIIATCVLLLSSGSARA